MLTEYLKEALERAKYEIIEDQDPYYGGIAETPGVWSTGKTLNRLRCHNPRQSSNRENAIAGAGSVVTKDVSPSTIVAGKPARILRKAI